MPAQARRITLLVLATLVLSAATGLAQSRFWIDGQGRVFTIDSFGRIAIDGNSTGWYPDRQNLDLQVHENGDAVYTDSYSRLQRNGGSLGYSWIRPHYFKLGRDGDIYTVHDWVSDTIQRNGHDTGYRIAKGSGFVADDDGRLWYTDERRGTLHVNGRDTGHAFPRDDFTVGPDGRLYYVVFHPNSGLRYQLFRFDPSSGSHEHVANLASREGFAFDHRNNLWMAQVDWRITRNGRDTGWRSYRFDLDATGRCYWADDRGRIHRDGENTGYVTYGPWSAARNGSVIYVGSRSGQELFRDGQSLGIRLSGGDDEPI